MALASARRCVARGAGGRARAGVRCAASASGSGRRELVAGGAGLALGAAGGLLRAPPSLAVQGLVAGRIPGTSKPDEDGNITYTRPEGKSGGHGVGWSEIPRYSFKMEQSWEEVPVSIADPAGSEIDVRFKAAEGQGSAAVVVAPIMRFADIPFNADVKIEDLGGPKKMITAFAPEIFGAPLEDDGILKADTETIDGLTYYTFDCKPRFLVKMTAYKNRLFIMNVTGSAIQFRKHRDDLELVRNSFQLI